MTKKGQKYTCSLLEIRADALLSQEQVADAIGISRQTINNIEKHSHEPTITTALKLARYFNMPVEMLFELNEPSQNKKDDAEKYIQQYKRESR